MGAVMIVIVYAIFLLSACLFALAMIITIITSIGLIKVSREVWKGEDR